MSNNQFTLEIQYRASMEIAKEMLKNEIITADDFSKVKTFLIDKFNPPLGAIC